jgi:hypothetical protein
MIKSMSDDKNKHKYEKLYYFKIKPTNILNKPFE